MSVTVRVPFALRRATDGKDVVAGQGTNVVAVIESVDDQHPGFSEMILTGEGSIKRAISVFVNGTDIRSLQGEKTVVADGDTVNIVMLMAGG